WSVLIKQEHRSSNNDGFQEDTMTFQQKHALVEVLQKLGGALREEDEHALDRRLRAPPLIAARHLTGQDAQLIASQLSEANVPAMAMKPGRWRRAQAFFLRTGTPGFAVVALVLVVIANAIASSAWTAGFLTLGVLVVVVWVWVLYLQWVLQPLARFSGAQGGRRDTSAVSDRARSTFEAIRSPRLRQLARQILIRGLALQDAIERRADMGPELARDVDAVMLRALDTVVQVATLEAELAARTPAEIHEELEVLEERLRTEDLGEAEAIIERRVALAEELAAQDERQAELARSASRLLETSAELTALRERLHGADWNPDEEEQAVSMILSRLEIEVEAREEVAAIGR
ncbi:MAG: hypothetical protein AAFX99_11145, partial [Myxococcota bacterium]